MVPGGVLHGDIAVAGEAVGLRMHCCAREREKQHRATCEQGSSGNTSQGDRRIFAAPFCRKQQRPGERSGED
jgi:hypothetical protein